jgi:hypothetical protein
MSDYAYTKVPGKLKDFLGKVRSLGVPTNISPKWLESIGYTSSNDRSILGVIRQIKFIDESNNTTEKWTKYRGGNYKQVLADGIREGYMDLFAIYPDANVCSNEELEDFFTTKSTAGKQVISAIVGTFKSLCELADFSAFPSSLENNDNDSIVKVPSAGNTPKNQETSKEQPGFTPKLHIDIQIHISPEATTQQIEQIFESMAKHIYHIKD